MTTNATDRSEALVERLFGATIGALELFSVYLGAELGLYRALEHNQDLNGREVSALAGIHERYAREWLEQQAVAGLIEVDDARDDAATRRYRLPEEYARVLCREGDPAHVAPFAHMIAGIGGVIERVADAYRTGRGVPYELYGSAFRYGQGHINRPAFTHELPGDWLAAAGRGRAAGGRHPPADRRRGLRAGLVDDRARTGLPQRLGRRPRRRPCLGRRRPPPRRPGRSRRAGALH